MLQGHLGISQADPGLIPSDEKQLFKQWKRKISQSSKLSRDENRRLDQNTNFSFQICDLGI